VNKSIFKNRNIAMIIFFIVITMNKASWGFIDPDPMESIIRNVQTNEALYKNIEVRGTKTYRLLDKSLTIRGAVDKSSSNFRFVQLGDKVYVKTQEDAKTVGGQEFDQGQTIGYDGRMMRAIYGQNICNIVNEKMYNIQFYRYLPHLAPFEMVQFPSVSLHKTLDGRGFKPFEGKGVYSTREIRSNFVNEERLDGMDCVVVRMRTVDPENDHEPEFFYYLYIWLAVDRNYIPIQMTVHNAPTHTRTKPLIHCKLSDLREISPGIWYPFLFEYKTFDNLELAAGKHIQDSIHQFKIESAILNPKVPDSLFSDIECPKSHFLYVVKNGEIVESRKPYTHSSYSSGSYFRKPWAIASIVIVAGFLGFMIVIWNRRKSAAASK
jgi:hypothetical protein